MAAVVWCSERGPKMQAKADDMSERLFTVGNSQQIREWRGQN